MMLVPTFTGPWQTIIIVTATLIVATSVVCHLRHANRSKPHFDGAESILAAEEGTSIVTESIAADKKRAALALARRNVAQAEDLVAILQPGIEACLHALDVLTKSDITELKSLAKPPCGVDNVVAAVRLLIEPAGEVDLSWTASQKAMSDATLLGRLIDHARMDAPPPPAERMAAVRAFTAHFSPDVMKAKSCAAAGLCKWVHGMVAHMDARPAWRAAHEALSAAQERLAALESLPPEREAVESVCTVNLLPPKAKAARAEAAAALAAAEDALQVLYKADVVEIKSFNSPPAGVKFTMEAVCIVLGVEPAKATMSDGTVVDDYWARHGTCLPRLRPLPTPPAALGRAPPSGCSATRPSSAGCSRSTRVASPARRSPASSATSPSASPRRSPRSPRRPRRSASGSMRSSPGTRPPMPPRITVRRGRRAGCTAGPPSCSSRAAAPSSHTFAPPSPGPSRPPPPRRRARACGQRAAFGCCRRCRRRPAAPTATRQPSR